MKIPHVIKMIFSKQILITNLQNVLCPISIQCRIIKRAAVMCRKQASLNIAALLITTAGRAGRAGLS